MDEDKKKDITPAPSGGMFWQLAPQIKSILRLLADRRVSPLVKLLPIGSLIYMVFPDIAPGPIDDAVVIWLGAYLFVELCPPDVVEEHQRALNLTLEGKTRDVAEDIKEEDIVDAEYWEEPK